MSDHIAVATATGVQAGNTDKPVSVFAAKKKEIYKYLYDGQMIVSTLTGGTPTDEKVAEAWIRKQLGTTSKELIREKVAETLSERMAAAIPEAPEEQSGEKTMPDVDSAINEAVDEVISTSNLVGFRSNETGMFLRDFQVKAMLKEAGNIRWPKRRNWGQTAKGTRSFFAEHIFVVGPEIYIKKNGEILTKPDGINQRFVHTWRGDSISYEEYVNDAEIDFQVYTDNEIDPDDWASLWVTAEEEGIGASRSQGSGRFVLTKWTEV